MNNIAISNLGALAFMVAVVTAVAIIMYITGVESVQADMP